MAFFLQAASFFAMRFFALLDFARLVLYFLLHRASALPTLTLFVAC